MQHPLTEEGRQRQRAAQAKGAATKRYNTRRTVLDVCADKGTRGATAAYLRTRTGYSKSRIRRALDAAIKSGDIAVTRNEYDGRVVQYVAVIF
jgi:DNA-binding MarR family transcriptional regulator